MNKTTTLFISLALLALSPSARATFGNPVQGPNVPQGGTLELFPSIGVLVGGDNDNTEDAESFIITPRVRYSAVDNLQLDFHLGGFIGDIDAFVLGAGAMYQFMGQQQDFPLDVSAFVNMDLAFGEIEMPWPLADWDVTYFTMLFGVMAGHKFDAGPIFLTPYFGIGLGFTFIEWDNNAAGDDDDTDIAFDILFGFEVAFSENISVVMEFDIGPTDGLPIFTWHLGMAYVF
jgi:opacity protein-like surface antigen